MRAHEPVPGAIFIQTTGNPTVVAARIEGRAAIALRIGPVAGVVEPMPAPTSPEVRRVKQAVDDALEGLGRIVVYKRRDFLRRRRITNEVIRYAPKEAMSVRLRGGREP